jgi:hypothetical protein
MCAVATGLWPVFGYAAVLRQARQPAGPWLQALTLLIRLAFGELETLPRAGLPGFFSLFHARIATQQALGFEWASQIYVDLKKRSRDRELCRAGLTHNAAAAGMNKQVVSVNRLRILQRLQHHILQRHSREIIFEGPAVDVDFSAARHHANACD